MIDHPLRAPLRRECNIQGGALLIYRAIMNVAVSVVMVFEVIRQTVSSFETQDFFAITESVVDGSAWGYFVAIAVGMLILLLWKKKDYLGKVICQRGKPMKLGGFFSILCFFMAGQMLYQLLAIAMEFLLNRVGLSMMDAMEGSDISTDGLGMFLYVGLGAPIFEEILFRGLVMRSLEPYGKKFAILTSALLFGLYHGNPLQTVYAAAVGVVLGYVAMEHNIFWAMVLHMFNNLTFADTLPRLLSNMPYETGELILWVVILVFSLVAILIAVIQRKKIAALWRQERIEEWQMRAFFCSPCMLILSASCVMDMMTYLFLMLLQ